MNRAERRADLKALLDNPRVTMTPTERSLRLVAQWQAKRTAQIKRLMPKPTTEQKLTSLVAKYGRAA